MGDVGSDNRIQGLSALRPVSLLRAYVAGHGYSLWPEDLKLIGNTKLVEASLASSEQQATSTTNVSYALIPLDPADPNLALLSFKLRWPHKRFAADAPELQFWHAVLCNTPRAEAHALAFADLGLSLLRYYETHYDEVGEMLLQLAQSAPSAPSAPTSPSLLTNTPSWSAHFFRLPQRTPSSLNHQTRAIFMAAHQLLKPIAPSASAQSLQLQQTLLFAGWALAAVLFVLLLVSLQV
jgi:hypothetical protein